MRTKRIHIVVSEEEKAAIQREAFEDRMTVSGWARKYILEGIVPYELQDGSYATPKLSPLVKQLRKEQKNRAKK